VTFIPNTTGNVPATFGPLPYAGTLWLTVLSDPDQVPDVRVLTTALRRVLGTTAERRSPQPRRADDPFGHRTVGQTGDQLAAHIGGYLKWSVDNAWWAGISAA
jgi:hypothetical protein